MFSISPQQVLQTVAGILWHSSVQISSRWRSGDWVSHSRTLKYFQWSQYFIFQLATLESLSCWQTLTHFIFNALTDGTRYLPKFSQCLATYLRSLTRISRTGPSAEKQPQSTMFPTLCFTVGMAFFGCNSGFFFRQIQQVFFIYLFIFNKKVLFRFWTFSLFYSGSFKCSVANFKWAKTCTGLWSRICLALQDLSLWQHSALIIVAFATLVPVLCKSFTRSLCGVLWFLVINLVIILTPRGEILHEASGRRRLSVGLFVSLPFPNNCSDSWFLYTRLLTYCRFSFPSLVQIYNYATGVLWQLFGCGHS